jgi:two-component system sensor histidine kinase CiaH
MFQSATLKLTAWYLIILMAISIVFSFAIYEITSNEVETRLQHFEVNLQNSGFMGAPPDSLRQKQSGQASADIAVNLLYANLFILIAGGTGSYFLARRTLRPIEEAHNAQARFSSDASHELRTPLAVMKTEIEVALRDKESTEEELRDVLSSNLEEVEKLTQLSSMLLTLSKLEHDKLEVKEFDITKLTEECIKRFAQPADRINLKSNKKLIATGNSAAITELICILLDNALKYSPDTSLVSIILSQRQQHVSFEITNTGQGISEEKLPHIFDRFYRADSSRTGGEQKGYGLGLALAKRIVEMHNGELSVTSEPGHRTTFTVLLSTSKETQAKNQK